MYIERISGSGNPFAVILATLAGVSRGFVFWVPRLLFCAYFFYRQLWITIGAQADSRPVEKETEVTGKETMHMNQTERRHFLINELLKEQHRCRLMEMPKDYAGQERRRSLIDTILNHTEL
jgi:hypothetical protein